MCEILFRGKQYDNDEWVQGSLILADSYCCILEKEENLHPMDVPYLNGEYGTFDGRATPIISETIGQYTGLTDKNGKKIFEGDIVKGWDVIFTVVFDEYCRWMIVAGEGHYLLARDNEDVEVIGNIHDNPELLKGGAAE